MLHSYQKKEHKIFKAQDLIRNLVVEVICKADNEDCYTKVKVYPILVKLYDNNRSDWFKKSIENIYKESKKLDNTERTKLIEVFDNNNNIQYLCLNPTKRLPISCIKDEVSGLLVDFFKELYSKFLSWKDVFSEFGTKKEYYDALIEENEFRFCPGCGYGIIKNSYDKGHSAFDHYLPLKHYPFSAVNFNNLFPLCNDCNSDSKGETDILKKGKRIFYPFNNNHPKIDFNVSVEPKSLIKYINKKERIGEKELKIDVVCEAKFNEELESWDYIFEVGKRYFGQVAQNGKSWLGDVLEKQRKTKETIQKSFDTIIDDDSNKHLGFLKSPFLSELKNYDSLIEAINESGNSSKIRNE